MYVVSWRKLSDGKVVRIENYDGLDEALAEAKEPVVVAPEGVEVIVTDPQGAVIFSTAPQASGPC